MSDSTSYNSSGKMTSKHIGAAKSDAEIASAQDRDRLTDTTRLGAKNEGGMPKPGPGEDMLSPAYKSRLSAWRSKQRGEAVTEMMKKP